MNLKSKTMKKYLPLVLAGLLAGGCANVEVKHVPFDDTSNGVHFYEPKPYLLVSKSLKTDKDGKSLPPEFSNQIIYLPNPKQRYAVKINPGWGTVDGSVKLVNGWMLDSLGSKMDSKIPETINAIAGLLKEAAAAASESPEGLYRIDFDPSSGAVSLHKEPGWK
jgi:hypothetical protein